MANVTTKEDTLFYKSMRLESASLNIEVKEKTPHDPAEVTIYHSPRKWKDDNFKVHLKNRAELKEYIAMLQDFDKRFGHLLDEVQAPEAVEDTQDV